MQFGPDPSGCYFQVDLCYKCGITGQDPSNLKVVEIRPVLNENCIAPEKDWLINKIYEIYSSLCTVPPCNSGCLISIIEYPLCFQWHTIGTIINGNYSYTSWLEPCLNSGYCQVTAKLCRDYETNQIIICPSDPLVTYEEFNVNCPNVEIPKPTQFSPDFIGERITSPCFKYETCP
jgi:hypothetical protein